MEKLLKREIVKSEDTQPKYFCPHCGKKLETNKKNLVKLYPETIELKKWE